MKLYKAINEQVPELSMEELLQMENDFLRDELELQDTLHSLELMETVLNCIEQEGCVSKSIEVMFGEGQDMSTFKDELQKAYDEAMEAFNINYDKKHSKHYDPETSRFLEIDTFTSINPSDVFGDVSEPLRRISKLVRTNEFNFPFEFGFVIGDNERSKRTAKAIEAAAELIDKSSVDKIEFADLDRIMTNVKSAFEMKSDMELNNRKIGSKAELDEYIKMVTRHVDMLYKACNNFSRIFVRIRETYNHNREKAEKSDNFKGGKLNAIERVLHYLTRFAYITCRKDVFKMRSVLINHIKK